MMRSTSLARTQNRICIADGIDVSKLLINDQVFTSTSS
jgi:hypothetical protein